jgi:hypothetical protein
MQTTCLVDECGRATGTGVPGTGHGWCAKHYKRWRKHGDPLITLIARDGLTECTISGCGRPHIARGWCGRHYDSWRFHGDPLAATLIFGDDEARFWQKVSKNGPVPDYAPHLGPCWLWTGGLDGKGYGQFGLGGKHVRAHRFAYELLVKPIPAGLDLDHLCRVITCVNPAHLEPVTRQVNRQRGVEAMLAARRKTAA